MDILKQWVENELSLLEDKLYLGLIPEQAANAQIYILTKLYTDFELEN